MRIWSSAGSPVLSHLLGQRFLKNFEVVEPSAAGYFCSGNTEELGGGRVEKEWIKQAVTHTHTWFMRPRPLPVLAPLRARSLAVPWWILRAVKG